MLPVVIIAVVVPKLPVLALPVTLKAPAVTKLPPVTLPVAETAPPVTKLPPVTLPVATTKPAVPKLPTLALPFAFNNVVDKLPVAALNDKLALAPNALFAVELPLTNTGKKVPVVCTVVTPKSLTLE